jgi:hypothetical protein
MPDVSAFSGVVLVTSSKVETVWKRRPRGRLELADGHFLDSFEDLDLLASASLT